MRLSRNPGCAIFSLFKVTNFFVFLPLHPSSLRPSECNGTKITRKKQLKIKNVVKSIQEELMPVETQPGTMKWFIDASDKCLSALEIIRWTG